MSYGFSLIVRGSDATPENFPLMADGPRHWISTPSGAAPISFSRPRCGPVMPWCLT
ncbi:MAG: hypothetical protein Ct9H300mP16_15470 [Pseudomonadota bacterium]|nr:MAG: hypothetical protein Ct9H300mP16_15470 [Pseudomonadota bacterium]